MSRQKLSLSAHGNCCQKKPFLFLFFLCSHTTVPFSLWSAEQLHADCGMGRQNTFLGLLDEFSKCLVALTFLCFQVNTYGISEGSEKGLFLWLAVKKSSLLSWFPA